MLQHISKPNSALVWATDNTICFLQTRQHPPVPAFNALLDACTRSGNMDLVHSVR